MATQIPRPSESLLPIDPEPEADLPPNGVSAIPVLEEPFPALTRAGVERIARGYLGEFVALLRRVDMMAIASVVELLRTARDQGATIFIAGNGGSASTATHWVNDLGKAAKTGGGPPLRVMSLTDNTSWLTALANDEGYERVFSGQLENFARPGDVLIVISASGSSPNVVDVVRMAKARGMHTVGLIGFDGGLLHGNLDAELWVETARGAYGLVETVHVLLADIITSCLIADGAQLDGK